MSKNLERFEQLSYGSLALGVVILGLEYESIREVTEEAGTGYFFTASIFVLIMALSVLLIWLVARKRKNWARWIWLFFFLTNILEIIPDLSDRFSSNVAAGTLRSISFLMQAMATYLLFSGDAREAFARPKPEQELPQ